MLHPIDSPGCIKKLLSVVFLQEELLKLTLSLDPRDPLNLQRYFRPEVVAWLWKHKQKLLDPLEEFYSHADILDKQQIIAAFQHDIDYQNHFDNPSFLFELRPLDSAPSVLAVGIGKWLENFYEIIIKKGIPADVTGHSSDISSQIIYAETFDANANLRVCPTCDGIWMENTSTGILGSIDHFLPRSKYPALSVHPVNLLPICSVCNEKIKEDKDPLTNGHHRTLPETFYFHRNAARNFVSLQVTTPKWIICDDGRCTPSQLLLFDDIFDIPGRWQKDVDEIDRMVRRRIRDSVDAVSVLNAKLSRNDFDNILKRLDQRMQDEWGESNHNFPATWWLRWLHQTKFDDLAKEFAV